MVEVLQNCKLNKMSENVLDQVSSWIKAFVMEIEEYNEKLGLDQSFAGCLFILINGTQG